MREIVSCRNTSASKSQKLTFTRRYTKWLKHNKHKVALQIMFVKIITKNKTELYFGMFNLTISYKDKIRLNFVVARIFRKLSSWFDFFLCYVMLNEIKLGVEKIWCFHNSHPNIPAFKNFSVSITSSKPVLAPILYN